MELDPLDRKVLYNVDLGSRAGLKGLARQCRTSPEVVRYRLARLEKEGAIRKHMALVNISSLGYVAHGVYCNYAGKDELEGIREFFLSHPNCHWAADFGGKYDFVFGLLAKDTFEFYRMLNGIKERMRGKLSGFDVAIRIRVDQYPRDYLLGTERRSVKKEAFFGDVLGKRKLDKLDFSILKRLAQDARAGVNEIASSIGANPNTVAFRMKKLEADGVLVGAVPQVCCQSYGYQSFQAYVETGGLDGKKRKAIGEYAASNPNIIFLIEAMGKWDFEIIYEVRSQKEIRAQIANLRECFPWIRQVQTDMVFDHYVKYDLFPFEKIGE